MRSAFIPAVVGMVFIATGMAAAVLIRVPNLLYSISGDVKELRVLDASFSIQFQDPDADASLTLRGFCGLQSSATNQIVLPFLQSDTINLKIRSGDIVKFYYDHIDELIVSAGDQRSVSISIHDRDSLQKQEIKFDLSDQIVKQLMAQDKISLNASSDRSIIIINQAIRIVTCQVMPHTGAQNAVTITNDANPILFLHQAKQIEFSMVTPSPIGEGSKANSISQIVVKPQNLPAIIRDTEVGILSFYNVSGDLSIIKNDDLHLEGHKVKIGKLIMFDASLGSSDLAPMLISVVASDPTLRLFWGAAVFLFGAGASIAAWILKSRIGASKDETI